MIADYQSMIVLLPWPPNNSPSVNSDSVRKYVDYKFLKRGEKLIYKATPVMTYKFPKIPHQRRGMSSENLRKEMKCVGTFHNPNSFKIFFAAINQVHENNNITGNYEPFCQNCWFSFKDRKGFCKSDCTHGPTYHNYACRGNPARFREIKDKKKQIELLAVKRGYKSKSKSPLFPSDVNDFAKYLRGVNYGRLEFAFYIFSLCGIKFALRYQGFSHIGFQSFERHNDLWKFLCQPT